METAKNKVEIELIKSDKVPHFEFVKKTFDIDSERVVNKLDKNVYNRFRKDELSGKYGIYYANTHIKEDASQHFFVKIDNTIYVCGISKINVGWENGYRIDTFDFIAYSKKYGFIKYKGIPNAFKSANGRKKEKALIPFLYSIKQRTIRCILKNSVVDANDIESVLFVQIFISNNIWYNQTICVFKDLEIIKTINNCQLFGFPCMLTHLLFQKNNRLYLYDYLSGTENEYKKVDKTIKESIIVSTMRSAKEYDISDSRFDFLSIYKYINEWPIKYNKKQGGELFDFYLDFSDLPILYAFGENESIDIEFKDDEPFYVLHFDKDNLYLIIKKMIKKGNNFKYGNYSIIDYVKDSNLDKNNVLYQLANLAEKHGCSTLGFKNGPRTNYYYGRSLNDFFAIFIFDILDEKYSIIDKRITQNYLNDPYSVKWKSEFKLYNYIKLIFPEAIYQYKAPWLDGLSLDIMIPVSNIAFEYQGQQHYEEVRYFGKPQSDILSETQERDQKKKEICLENGVKLIEWKYSLDITFDNLINILKSEAGIFVDCEGIKNIANNYKGLALRDISKIKFIDNRHSQNADDLNSIPQKRVVRYDRNGFYVDDFLSQKDASEITYISELEINIACAAFKNYYLAGGYQWRYCDEGFDDEIGRYIFDVYNLAFLEVNQFTKDGVFIKKHPSLYEASKKTGIMQESIFNAARGIEKTAGSYVWRFVFPSE